jgi:hypothetical protein
MKPIFSIEKREWRWLTVAIILVLLFSSIPYAFGYFLQNSQTVFGGAVVNRPDYNVYLADIQSGLKGIPYYPMLHSPEEVKPVYLRLFYVWVGWLGRVTGFSAQALFQLARWMCGALALTVMYWLAAFFFQSVSLRRLAWILFLFGSGFGWLRVLFHAVPAAGIGPPDFSQIELYGFLTILLTPHFALTESLQWGMALAFLAGWSESPRANLWLGIGILCAFAAQTIQLLAPLTLDLALVGYALWHWLQDRRMNRREAVSLLILALVQLPWAGYSLWVFQTDPVWRSYAVQNVVLSPTVMDNILGLGLVGLLLLLGVGRVLMFRRLGKWHVLALWTIVIAVASYWPVTFQRRFVAGGMGPIAVLAVLGIVGGVWPFIRRIARARMPYWHSLRTRIVGIILLIVSQSTILFMVVAVTVLAGRLPADYDSSGELQAMRWLEIHSAWQDPVFASEETGNVIPAVIGHRVYAGHWAESTNYRSKVEEINLFFQPGTADADRFQILRTSGCRYVFYGPRERELGIVDFRGAGFLKLVYDNPTVQLYEFIPP